MDPSETALVPKGKHERIIPRVQSLVPLRHSEPNLRSHRLQMNSFHELMEVGFLEGDVINENDLKPQGSQIDSLSVVLSALYCKLIVVFGVALPITQIISHKVPPSFYHGFYIYMYGGSLAFIISLHLINLKKTTISKIMKSKSFINKPSIHPVPRKSARQRINNYGSFYLRLGATAFGIGSMVYSGLEFGEYFVSEDDPVCKSILLAIKPVLRMAFTVLQLHFIFLSDNSMDILKNQVMLRFSLAHMLATNLSEWLSVIVEETKHEINHLTLGDHHSTNLSNFNLNTTEFLNCTLHSSEVFIRDASSYLFPCTIEYSLICAVTLIEMWKDVQIESKQKRQTNAKNQNINRVTRHQYSVDCTHSQKGLICGLVFNVYTIITLIIFFSLRLESSGEETAAFLVVICETLIYFASFIAMITAAVKMHHLPYCIHRLDSKGSLKLGLDLTLLFKALIGAYSYTIFSAFGSFFTPGARVWPDLLSLLQTTAQTVFILDAWWKRCGTKKDQNSKPGREMITFLRIINMALWVISITEKNRAQLRPVQLQFFGLWTWVVITHVSMPLAIFYRFHSAICLFEIWRNAYKDTSADINHDVVFT